MLLRLLLLFTLVPLAELYLLVQMSRWTSIPATIALVLVTGILGASLARRQGWLAWRRVQEQLSRGEPPAAALLDGLLILIAGALLITPGILTDIAGFLLMIPAVRALFHARLRAWLKAHTAVQFRTQFGGGFAGGGFTGFESARAPHPADDSVIDVEFTRHPPESEPGEHQPRIGPPHDPGRGRSS